MSIIKQGILSADLDAPITSPTLNLDFANSQSLDSRITFTRGSIGTFVNKNGFIETAQANQPRFDYDPISGECKGLFIEEGRTNIVLNSTTLSSHSNSATTTVLTSETISPDGTFNAYKIIGNSGVKTRESIFTNAFTMNANSSYTASVFLKGTATRRYVVMWFDNTAPGNAPVEGPFYGSSTFIDLLTGTSNNPTITKIIPYGNGWYRCYLTATVGVSNLTNVYLNVSIGSPNGFSDTGNPSQYKYVGDGNSGIYYWGPQVEVGAFPTSYIPTTSGSTVTRSADLADMTGTNFSSWYNSNEGTIFVNALTKSTQDGSGFFTLDNGSAAEYIRSNIGFSKLEFVVSTAFGNTAQIFSLQNVPTNTSFKGICSYKTNYVASSFNGSSAVTDAATSLPNAANRIRIGFAYYLTYTNGTISRLTYYPKALSLSQLQYLTQ